MKKNRAYVLITACFLLTASTKGFVQNAQQDLQDVPSLTALQWARRVEEARVRSEEFVANARTGKTDPVQSNDEDVKAADQRAMNDPSLRSGDIVSTSMGLLVYVGSEEVEPERREFRPAFVSEMTATQSRKNSPEGPTKSVR